MKKINAVALGAFALFVANCGEDANKTPPFVVGALANDVTKLKLVDYTSETFDEAWKSPEVPVIAATGHISLLVSELLAGGTIEQVLDKDKKVLKIDENGRVIGGEKIAGFRDLPGRVSVWSPDMKDAQLKYSVSYRSGGSPEIRVSLNNWNDALDQTSGIEAAEDKLAATYLPSGARIAVSILDHDAEGTPILGVHGNAFAPAIGKAGEIVTVNGAQVAATAIFRTEPFKLTDVELPKYGTIVTTEDESASAVGYDAPIGLKFNTKVTKLADASISFRERPLTGTATAISATLLVEKGKIFLKPQSALRPKSTYELSIAGVSNVHGQDLEVRNGFAIFTVPKAPQ